MKAIRRNVLLACIISTFCFFGLLGRKPTTYNAAPAAVIKKIPAEDVKATKESFTLFAVIGTTWILCFWRCSVINRRLASDRMYKQRYDQYMRNNLYAGRR